MAPSESAFSSLVNFDIDYYLNPWIPHNRLYVLPKSFSRWLGYRSTEHKEPPVLLQYPITFLATVAGLCLVGGVTNYGPGIREWQPPVLVASLGASAVLDFNTIRSPLAQPRNAVIGNTIAAICGVAIAKLFQHNADFAHINWVSAAVGCAVANLGMSLTNTVHPPGGATAVLASIQSDVLRMGWRYVPLVLLSSTLMTTTALIFNNLMRQYPVYWWTSSDVGRKLRRQRSGEKAAEEGAANKIAMETVSDASSDRTLHRELSNRIDFHSEFEDIRISSSKIQMPSHVGLSDAELSVLEKIQQRLMSHA